MKSWLEASHAVSDAAAEAVADRTDLAAEAASARPGTIVAHEGLILEL